jgi:hypothetical protein
MPTIDGDAFRRLHELIECLGKPKLCKAWRGDFAISVASHPARRAHFTGIESDLAGLDAIAWAHLRHEIAGQINLRDPALGWRQAIDLLNQASAYHYLRGRGCTDIAFLPKSSTARTPDLQAKSAAASILCEVKTVNIARIDGNGRLPPSFFKKFATRLHDAVAQMASFDRDGDAERIVYVVLAFAGNLRDAIPDCMDQVQAFVRTSPILEAEIVFDVKAMLPEAG